MQEMPIKTDGFDLEEVVRTDVWNLKTDEIWSFCLPPDEALMAAALQEKGDFNTFNYWARFPYLRPQIVTRKHGDKTVMSLGNWSCIVGVDLLSDAGAFERKMV